MKNVSAKKVFAIMGIVFGAVAVFAGAVFGVMALMGKFKNPIVYPTELEFAITEEVIIEGKPYDTSLTWEENFADKNQSPKIESFILSGSNAKAEHEVNQKDCYLWFGDNESSELITLCDSNGKPLEKQSNGRYLVKCNEPIYYMVNKLSPDYETDGRVQLFARSSNETLAMPSSPKTIWIDRSVQGVFVKSEGWGDEYFESTKANGFDEASQNYKQSINLGVGFDFNFNFKADSKLSLKPVSNASLNKEIELYYAGQGAGNDFIQVTSETILSKPLSDIIKIREGAEEPYAFEDLSFVPTSQHIGNHTFYIAVFKTFAAKEQYAADIEGEDITTPNHHRVTSKNASGEKYMSVTELSVNVTTSEISSITFGEGLDLLKLDLFKQKTVYASDSTQDNDLGLSIFTKNDADYEEIDGDSYTNIKFGAPEYNKVGENFVAPIFMAKNSTDVLSGDLTPGLISKASNIYLGENTYIIEELTVDGTQYYCSNGVAVYDGDESLFKVLKPGVYLSFYYYEIDKYLLEDLNIESTKDGNGTDVHWSLIPKQLAETDRDLYLGALAVNNKGFIIDEEGVVGSYFATLKTTIEAESIEFTKNDIGLNVTFSGTSDVNFDAEKPFNQVVDITKGSYDATVLMVKEGTTTIETINDIKYFDGTDTYVLVGYIDGFGKFVNSVKLKTEDLTVDNHICELFMLQFENSYNQTAEKIIEEILGKIPEGCAFIVNADGTQKYVEVAEPDNATTLGENLVEVVKFYNQENDEIQLTINYELNTDLLLVNVYQAYSDNKLNNKIINYSFYENQSKQTYIAITSTHQLMLGKVCALDNSNTIIINVLGGVITFESAVFNGGAMEGETPIAGGALIIPFSTTAYNKTYEKQQLQAVWVGKTIELGEFTIQSGKPSQLVYRYEDESGELNEVNLNSSATGENSIDLAISYNGTGFVYEYSHNGITIVDRATPAVPTFPFNSNFNDADNSLGFQDAVNKKQAYSLEYMILVNGVECFDPTNSIGNIYEYLRPEAKVCVRVTVKNGTDTLLIQYLGLNVNVDDTIKLEYTDDVVGEKVTTSDKSYLIKDAVTSNIAGAHLSYIVDNIVAKSGDETLTLGELGYYDKLGTLLLETSFDNTDGWKFERTTVYNPLNITLDVYYFGKKLSLEIEFTSNIQIGLNDVWKSHREFYTGTIVQLKDADYSVFKISGVDVDDVSFKINGGETPHTSATLELRDNDIGTMNFEIMVNESSTGLVYSFKVKPNVVVTKATGTFESDTDTPYQISSLYGLQKYKALDATAAYGSSEDNLYWKYDSGTKEYDRVNLEDRDTSNLTIEVDAGTSGLTLTGGNSLTIGQMQELGASKDIFVSLKYDSYYITNDDQFTITNKHDAPIINEVGEDGEHIYISQKEYTGFVTPPTDFVLTLIEDENGDIQFASTDGSIKVTSFVSDEITTDIILTFTYDGKTYTYEQKDVTIKPYIPTKNNGIEVATAGANYDILDKFYTGLVSDDLINELTVVDIIDENGESVDYEPISDNGYVKDRTDGKTNEYIVKFKDFVGSNKTYKVKFKVIYNDNTTTHEYLEDITVANSQPIELKYPESDAEIASAQFKFVEAYSKGDYNYNKDAIGNLFNISYESKLVFTDGVTTLNLTGDDQIKKIKRVEAEISKVSIVAYQTSLNMTDYYAGITISGTEITFPKTSTYGITSGFNGLIIFKVETESGNYDYYNIYVYCDGSFFNINEENNLEILAYETDNKGSLTGGDVECVITTTTTYQDILNDNSVKTKLKEKLKSNYDPSTMKIYLYEGIATADTFAYNGFRYTNVETETITYNAKFNTITLGLVKVDGFNRCCLGTITIYVLPTNALTFAPELKYNVPNGQFTAEIEASASKIVSPFGADWEVSILDINSNNSSAYEQNADDASEIILGAKEPNDVTLVAKYTYNDTFAIVTYTYKATTIHNETPKTTLGAWADSSGFVTTINLADETNGNYQKFFGNYAGLVTIECTSGNSENVVISDKTLKFTQTYEDQEFGIKITYTNYTGDIKEKIFTFEVQKGVYIKPSGEGTDSGNRLLTTPTGEYTRNIGSTTDFTKEQLDSYETIHYKYSIGGLEIYTKDGDPTFNLTFDKPQFVIDKKDVTNGIKLEFAHSAVNMPVNMAIEMFYGGNKVDTSNINCFLTVAKTYSHVEAIYLTEGATHENVVKGSTIVDNPATTEENEGLRATLFDSSRFKLLGTTKDADGNYIEITSDFNLYDMGFGISGNPNYISFTTLGHCSLGSDSVTFNNVSENTICTIKFSNEAGLTSDDDVDSKYNRYQYQIMPYGKADGLDYSVVEGIKDTKESEHYVSFSLGDHAGSENAYSKEFTLGRMWDLENKSVFSVSSSTDGCEFGAKTIITEESNNERYKNAIQYSATYSGYTIYVILDLDSNLVELLVERAQDTPACDVEFNLSLGGVNGNTTIEDDLKIILNNDNISKVNQNSENVYGCTDVDLTTKFSGIDGLTLEFKDGSYSYGTSGAINITSTANNLFTFVAADKTLKLEHVGETVDAVANFYVIKENYKVAIIEYNFNVLVNLVIAVNGENANVSNTYFSTNFVLTNVGKGTGDLDNFNLTHQLKTKSDYVESNNMAYDSTEKEYYYNILMLDLYNVQGYDPSPAESLIDVQILSPNEDVVSYDKDNRALIFKQDYNGDIRLKLSVETSNGTYSVNWTISVTPIYDHSYKLYDIGKDPNYQRIDNNDIPLSSGVSVNIISNNSSENCVGIYAITSGKFNSNIALGEVDVTYRYVITKADNSVNSLSNKDLFEGGSPVGPSSGTVTFDSSKKYYSVTMPDVPISSSTNPQVYFVTYEISLTYLNKETSEYYITYRVVNTQNITTYDYQPESGSEISSKVVCVDDDNRLEGTKLDLFYFAQNFKHGTTPEITYKLTLKEESNATYVVLNDGANDLVCSDCSLDEITFTKLDVPSYKYNKITKTLSKETTAGSDEYTTIVSNINWTNTTEYTNENKFSVFRSNFTNIFEFKRFIDVYYNKSSVKINDKDFTLCYLGNGRFGVDLAAANGNLFDNEITTELKLMVDNSVTYTVSDFKLYSSNTITPKSLIPLTDIISESYYDKGSLGLEMEDISIIGFGNVATIDWVNKASVIASESDEFATIKIFQKYEGEPPVLVAMYNEYHIKKVTFTGSNAGSYYTTTAVFFYIVDSKVVVPNYGIGLGNSYFSVKYDTLSINLAEGFKVWSTDDSTNTIKYDKATSIAISTAPTGVSITGNVLTIDKDTVDTWKLNNPTSSIYTFPVTFEVDETTTVTCDFKVNVEAIKLTASSEYTATLPIEITSITEEGNGGYIAKLESDYKTINLKAENVNTYFEENPGETSLKVVCVTNTKVKIEITINRPAS